MLLKSGLGWIRGYPGARKRAGLSWTPLPQTGGGPVEPIVLSRAHLQRATRTLNTLRREHRGVLPTLLGDPERWDERTRALLEAIKPTVHRGERLPPVSDVLARTHTPKAARTLVSAREENPELAPLLNAIAWVYAREDKALHDALRFVNEHRHALTRLVSFQGAQAWPADAALDPLTLALRLVDMGLLDGATRIAPLLANVADPLSHAVVLHDGGASPKKLAKALRRGLELAPPSKPKANYLAQLLSFVSWLLAADKKPRRLALELYNEIGAQAIVKRWAHWWRRLEAAIEEAQRLAAHPPVGSKAAARMQAVTAELDRLGARVPVQIHPDRIIRAIEGVSAAPPQYTRPLRSCLRAIPPAHKGMLLKLPMLQLWFAGLDANAAKRTTLIMTELRGLLSEHDPIVALAPWGAYLQHASQRSPHYHRAPDGWMRYTEAPVIRCFFGALRAGLARDAKQSVATRAKKWSLGPRINLLRELAQLTSDGMHAEQLLHELFDVQDEQRGYWPTELLTAAVQLSRGDPKLFGRLVPVLDKAELSSISFDDDNPLGIAKLCEDDGLADTFARMVLAGETKRVHRLGGRVLLLEALGARRVPARIARVAERAEWMTRYPDALAAHLCSLASVDRRAERSAEQLLGKSYPDPADLAVQMAAVRAQLRQGDGDKRRRLQKRLDNLNGRKRAAVSPSERQLTTQRNRLDALIERRAFESWEERLERALGRALGPALGFDELPHWLLEQPSLGLLPHLAVLEPESRKLAFKVLRARAGSYPWDLRSAPPNRQFVTRLVARGIDMAPWLEGIGVTMASSKRGEVYLQLERDPLEVLLMGKHFDTCLSPGWFNFFSAVSNAADINKRVLYARDRHGTVVGRCLLALTDDAALLTFHAYCHDEDGWNFQSHASKFVLKLSERMGTTPVTHGEVSKLVATSWYDDGPIDLTGRFASLRHGSAFAEVLDSIEPAELVGALERELAPIGLNAVTIPMVLAHASIRKRPELNAAMLEVVRREPQLPLGLVARTCARAHSANQQRAREVMARYVLPRIERHTNREHVPAAETLRMLVDMGEASLVMRLLARSRQRGVRSVLEEPSPHRLWIAGLASEQLHRRKQAAAYYRAALTRRVGAPLQQQIEARLSALG